jgi:site-specific DNA-methyltransferase (cytosine-N4-specific)
LTVPYFTDGSVTLYTGDALDVLRELPGESADCVVTSPPYWGLRDYGTGRWAGGEATCAHLPRRVPRTARPGCGDGIRSCSRCGAVREDRQYGIEATPEQYVDHLRAVFAELRRVLGARGTVWLNLGDSYSATPPGRTADPMRASTLTNRAAVGRLRESVQRADVDRTRALPRKNLAGMPWRVALALQGDGWILRNAIVWHKPNAMPQSARDRLSNRYETLFLLVRQERYHFDLDAIRDPAARSEAPRTDSTAGDSAAARRGKYTSTSAFTKATPGAAMRPTGRQHTAAHPKGRNPGDVWTMSTRPLRAAHFATFPVDLPLRCIAAGCPPGGTVLDPFSGAATTGLAARRLGRSYVGIDLNPAFHDIALDRLGLALPGRPS